MKLVDKLRTDEYLIPIAFFCIYFIWGSTYLATKWAFLSFPPFAMTALRLAGAGVIMMAFNLPALSGVTKEEIKNAVLIGLLILGFGAGGSMWAVQFLDTGLASLVVGSEPLVLVLMTWLLVGIRPSVRKWIGIALGSLGMYILISQHTIQTSDEAWLGLVALAIAILAWALGAIYINKLKMPESKPLSAGIQMLSAGVLLFIVSLSVQEDWASIPVLFQWKAFFSWLYLMLFGSIIAYSAFNYLLLKVDPRRVSTCTYVNPIIALFLGWSLNNEIITTQSILASAVLISGVVFINSEK